ncbi:hypothetical protein Dimus_039421 [Dionaea muscipula]
MRKIKECSQSDLADKSIVGSLMNELTTKKFDWSQPIQDHVTHMSNLAAKLKTMGMKELKAMLIQEEGRLRKMEDQSIHLIGHDDASSSKGRPGKKDKKKDKAPKGLVSNIRKEMKCFFCKKSEHFKKDCPKRKAWFEKKGMHYSYVFFESNLIEVPNNTWWLDSGATTHVSHIKQGFSSIQPDIRVFTPAVVNKKTGRFDRAFFKLEPCSGYLAQVT